LQMRIMVFPKWLERIFNMLKKDYSESIIMKYENKHLFL
jgi:hypothetical protein